MPHNFSSKCDILLLFQSPKNCGPMDLTVCEEPILSPVISSVCYLLGSSVQRVRMDWTIPPIGEKELWTRGCEVYMSEGCNVEDSSGIWDEFEEPIPRFFEVLTPVCVQSNSRLGAFFGFNEGCHGCDLLGLLL